MYVSASIHGLAKIAVSAVAPATALAMANATNQQHDAIVKLAGKDTTVLTKIVLETASVLVMVGVSMRLENALATLAMMARCARTKHVQTSALDMGSAIHQRVSAPVTNTGATSAVPFRSAQLLQSLAKYAMDMGSATTVASVTAQRVGRHLTAVIESVQEIVVAKVSVTKSWGNALVIKDMGAWIAPLACVQNTAVTEVNATYRPHCAPARQDGKERHATRSDVLICVMAEVTAILLMANASAKQDGEGSAARKEGARTTAQDMEPVIKRQVSAPVVWDGVVLIASSRHVRKIARSRVSASKKPAPASASQGLQERAARNACAKMEASVVAKALAISRQGNVCAELVLRAMNVPNAPAQEPVLADTALGMACAITPPATANV